MSPGRGRLRRPEELPQSVHAHGQPRRLAQATASQAFPGVCGTRPTPQRSLSSRAGTANTQGAAGCAPPLPHSKSAGAQGTAAFREVLPHPCPTPLLPPAAGGGGGDWGEPTRNSRKSCGGRRGPSSRAFETALLVLDGLRAAVL